MRGEVNVSRACLLPFVLLLASCGGGNGGSSGPHDGLVPGGAIVLSPANPAASPKDEDPCIILDSIGRFHLAWLSNRDGNDEIYVMHSSDGKSWSSPNRVTSNADSDWYPTLIQDSNRYHIVWMRQTATTRTVWYNSSPDGITWNSADEQPVTTGVSDDFVPYLIAVGGVFHVYFDSEVRSGDGTRGLFHVTSTGRDSLGTSTGWSAPSEIAPLNDVTESDQFPFVAARPTGGYLMTFIRHAGSTTAINGYLDATSDINYATSADGVAWMYGGVVMAEDGVTDTIPALYTAGREVTFTFLRGIGGQPHIIDYDFSLLGSWPTGLHDVTAANGVGGWSSRVTHTLKSNHYIRVWTGASDLRIYREVFTR